MCIMEIHEDATRSTMIQAVAHNLSTVDRDLDMLRKVGESREDHKLVEFANSLQARVHAAYAEALMEFGMSLADIAQDPEGHIHRETDAHGHERSIFVEMVNATNEAKVDETR